MKNLTLENFIFLGGVGHIFLGMGSLLIPKLLSWKTELSGLKPLFRQMFWTYAAYILTINIFFGVISIVDPQALTDHSFLSIALTFFISLYWIGRVLIQFFYFDRSAAPSGKIYQAGEALLIAAFLYFAIVYGYAFFVNIAS